MRASVAVIEIIEQFVEAVPAFILNILYFMILRGIRRTNATDHPLFPLTILIETYNYHLLFIIVIGITAWVGNSRLTRLYWAKNSTFSQTVPEKSWANWLKTMVQMEFWTFRSYAIFIIIMDYLGLGVAPPSPNFGSIISDGYSGFRTAPHIVLMPAFAATLMLIALTLMAHPTKNIDYWRDLIKRNWYF